MALPVVKMVVSRQDNDCALCALAMLTGTDYNDVLLAVNKVDTVAGKRGLWSTQITKAGALLGFTFRTKRKFDIENDTGILNVKFPDGEEHAILLKGGMVFNSDGTIWEVEDYIAAEKLKVGCLLVLDDAP